MNSPTNSDALLQPRLVRHLLEGGALRRFSADGPNDARDNFHVLRWNGYRFDVRGIEADESAGDRVFGDDFNVSRVGPPDSDSSNQPQSL